MVSLAEHIEASLKLPAFIAESYLEDLTDDDLFVRPFDTMNHIAWQLGHLISSENFHVNQLDLGSMPPLPAGFAEKHTKETASSDDRSAFYGKSEYLQRMSEQRAGTLSVLANLSDAALSEPAPEPIRYLGPTIGSIFAGESVHWMMHAGQWAVVRRKLGKPPLF